MLNIFGVIKKIELIKTVNIVLKTWKKTFLRL